MTNLSEATQRLTACFFQSIRHSGGYHPEEADPELNEANQDVIQAMAAAHGGECWLGRVNLYYKLPEDEDDDGEHEPFHADVPLTERTSRDPKSDNSRLGSSCCSLEG